jgi:hypothetical protein
VRKKRIKKITENNIFQNPPRNGQRIANLSTMRNHFIFLPYSLRFLYYATKNQNRNRNKKKPQKTKPKPFPKPVPKKKKPNQTKPNQTKTKTKTKTKTILILIPIQFRIGKKTTNTTISRRGIIVANAIYLPLITNNLLRQSYPSPGIPDLIFCCAPNPIPANGNVSQIAPSQPTHRQAPSCLRLREGRTKTKKGKFNTKKKTTTTTKHTNQKQGKNKEENITKPN